MKDLIRTGKLVPLATIGKGESILAAGPLSKQPHTLPYRIVLIGYDDGTYSVHHQMFSGTETSLAIGIYFHNGPEELEKATATFGNEVAKHAHFLKSLFKE